MDFSSDSRYLLTVNMAGAVKLWSTEMGRCVVTYRGYSLPAWGVRFGPHSRVFSVMSGNGNAFVYNTDDVQFVARVVVNYSDITCFAWESVIGGFVGYHNGDVNLLNMESVREGHTSVGHSRQCDGLWGTARQ